MDHFVKLYRIINETMPSETKLHCEIAFRLIECCQLGPSPHLLHNFHSLLFNICLQHRTFYWYFLKPGLIFETLVHWPTDSKGMMYFFLRSLTISLTRYPSKSHFQTLLIEAHRFTKAYS